MEIDETIQDPKLQQSIIEATSNNHSKNNLQYSELFGVKIENLESFVKSEDGEDSIEIEDVEVA